MNRSDDVPSWRSCFISSLKWTGWVLPVVCAMVTLFTWSMISFNSTTLVPIVHTTFYYVAFNIMAVIVWFMLFLGWTIETRLAETPKEREAHERRVLERLKAKYE